MKKLEIYLLRALVCICISLLAISCAKDDNDLNEINDPTHPQEIPEEKLKSILENIDINWGESKDDVQKKMKGYTVVSGTKDDVLQYKSGSISVAYQFGNEHLCASALMFPSGSKNIDLKKMLGNFNSVGIISEGEVYQNLNINTLAVLWQPVDSVSGYNSIGFAPINSSDFEATSPVKVTTGHIEPKMISAQASGDVKGADLAVEVGFIYGNTPNIDENNGKIVSTTSSSDFKLNIKGLLDSDTIYYCAFAKVDGAYFLGDVNEFMTNPLQYTIDGKTYDMVKVVGGPTGDFSIMQTELPPSSTFTIEGMTFGPLDSNGDFGVTKAEMRTFLNDLRDRTGLDFRLPKAEEWTFAAKGGNDSQGYTYSGSNNIDDVAWYKSNSDKVIHPIAQKQPNEIGLYDMSGNYGEVTFQVYTNNSTDIYGVDGDFYGGNCKSSNSGCKPTSKEFGLTSGNVESNTKLKEYNAFDAKLHTVRMIFERH